HSHHVSLFFSVILPHHKLPSFPTRRSSDLHNHRAGAVQRGRVLPPSRRSRARRRSTLPWLPRCLQTLELHSRHWQQFSPLQRVRSEEHTSELQSRGHLVCRLLLEKKKQ